MVMGGGQAVTKSTQGSLLGLECFRYWGAVGRGNSESRAEAKEAEEGAAVEGPRLRGAIRHGACRTLWVRASLGTRSVHLHLLGSILYPRLLVPVSPAGPCAGLGGSHGARSHDRFIIQL
jgi:hypothetical protein